MNDKSVKSQLWHLINQRRSKGQGIELLELLQVAINQGSSITLNDLRDYVDNSHDKTVYLLPEFISNFITAYLKDNPTEEILDCYAKFGSLLAPIVQKFSPKQVIGINESQQDHEVAKIIHANLSIDWRAGNILKLLEEINSQFDVIVGDLPFGLKADPQTLTTKDGKTICVRDELGRLVMLQAAMRLKPKGVGFFLVSPSFFFSRTESSVYTNLQKFGLFVQAALWLPHGTFAPAMGIGGFLLVLRREPYDQLFVGELTINTASSGVLLKNLKSHKEGKIPRLGKLVDPSSFRSFPGLLSGLELQSLAVATGLQPIRFRDIVAELHKARPTGKNKRDFTFPELPNSIYLQVEGRFRASTTQDSEFKPNRSSVYIALDPDKAIAEYVVNFFNTSVGQKVLESLSAGVTIPRINTTDLLDAPVYLPDLKNQLQAISIQSEITNLQTELESLQRRLWNHPRKVQNFQKELKSLNRDETLNCDDKFEHWLETIPFPIASILWAYHADSKAEKKVEHLLHFFEALSEFTAVPMLRTKIFMLKFLELG